MVCAKKYCPSLRAAVTKARDTFLIFWYLVFGHSKALLVKYVGLCPSGVSD